MIHFEARAFSRSCQIAAQLITNLDSSILLPKLGDRFSIGAERKSNFVDDTFRQLASDLGHRRAASEIVADAIRHLISAGRLLPGDRLPPEREFAPALGAARVTVRAAIKLLSNEGILLTEKGRTGGTIVLDKRTKAPAKSIAHFSNAIAQSFEFRSLVEPAAAALAAERGSDADRQKLLALVRQKSNSQSTFNDLDTRFHLLVARMTCNPHIRSAIENTRSSFFILVNSLFLKVDVSKFPDFADEHANVAKAIVIGDARAAKQEMAAHIRRSHRQFTLVLKERS